MSFEWCQNLMHFQKYRNVSSIKLFWCLSSLPYALYDALWSVSILSVSHTIFVIVVHNIWPYLLTILYRVLYHGIYVILSSCIKYRHVLKNNAVVGNYMFHRQFSVDKSKIFRRPLFNHCHPYMVYTRHLCGLKITFTIHLHTLTDQVCSPFLPPLLKYRTAAIRALIFKPNILSLVISIILSLRVSSQFMKCELLLSDKVIYITTRMYIFLS